MARSNGQGGSRSVARAAARLDEINREVAEILRFFPDLRTFQRGRARGPARPAGTAASRFPPTRAGALQRSSVLH